MAIRVTNDASALKRSANSPAQTALTIAGWFKFDSVTPALRFWGPLGIYGGSDGIPTAGNTFYQISSDLAASPNLVLTYGGGGGTTATVSLATVRADTWYFAAITGGVLTAGGVRAYLRASYEKQFAKAVSTGTAGTFTFTRFEFGRDAFLADYIDGVAQNCVAFDRQLDDAELMKLSVALARDGRIPDRRNLNVYYRLRSNTDISDLSGNGRAFTATVGANAQGYRVRATIAPDAPPPASGSDVTLALTGNAATGGVGTLGLTHAEPLSGNAGTLSPGTLGINHAQALTGNAAAAGVGSVVPSSAVTLTGNAAAGQVGTLAAGGDAAAALTGNAATASVGTLAVNHSQAITGNAAAGAVGTLAVAHAEAITGNSATGSVGTVTPAATVALTGNAAAGQVGTLDAGSDGSEALTGNAATGSVGTMAPTHAQAITGNAAAGAVGTLAPGKDVAISGNVATSAVGSMGVQHAQALTGNAASGQAGSLSPTQAGSAGLTGVSAAGGVGSLAIAHVEAITGNSATGSVGSVGIAQAQALTGNAAAGSVGTVTPSTEESQSQPLTGVSATGSVGTMSPSTVIGPCEQLNLTAKNPQIDKVMAVAFLDKYGRFAKSDEDVYTIRLFYPATYCNGTYELTALQFKALSAADKLAIRESGSAAGLIDTEGKSNA